MNAALELIFINNTCSYNSIFSISKLREFIINAIDINTVITNSDQLDLNGSYTYADYLLWQFKERMELVKAIIFKMSLTSSRKHQGISMSITLTIAKFLKDQDYKMYAAPFDVRLNDDKVSTGDNQIITAV